MLYLDNGATSLRKPAGVEKAMCAALHCCANPGRGGYPQAMEAARTVYRCRENAAALFDCQPEQVIFTGNCTEGLNMAISSLVEPGNTVLISGFEHNAVTRTLHGRGAKIRIAGRKLFDWADTLESFENGLKAGADAAVFLHMSNVFGYILPVDEMAGLCRQYHVPFILDCAQSAGTLPVSLKELGASFIAMPGHKGLLGPQGTGLLLCADKTKPLIFGGTGSLSVQQRMPEELPDRMEPGTLNVPGIAGLNASLEYLRRYGMDQIRCREHQAAQICAEGLTKMGFRVFSGEHQGGTVSFLPKMDCEDAAEILARQGIAVRAGLHCAPMAHESAGTLETGTVRVSFGMDASPVQSAAFLHAASKLKS